MVCMILLYYFFELSQASDSGDIKSINYLSLRDNIDKDVYSLENYMHIHGFEEKISDRIHLLRGNHEDILINYTFGYLEEVN